MPQYPSPEKIVASNAKPYIIIKIKNIAQPIKNLSNYIVPINIDFYYNVFLLKET